MAQAARAYQYSAYPEYADQGFSASDVRAMRTGGDRNAEQSPNLLATIGRLAAFVIVLVAALSFARIALTNAAVTTMIESDSISAQITEARATGVELEMKQSVLTSPAAINSAAKRLNMDSPGAVGTIVLDPDIVAYSEKDGLSLSDSVKNVVGTQE